MWTYYFHTNFKVVCHRAPQTQDTISPTQTNMGNDNSKGRPRALSVPLRGRDEEAHNEKPRPLSLSTLQKANEGNHEVECCYQAATLWSRQRICLKNPGHSKFIPVGQFGAGHLPLGCRDHRLVAYIRLASRFTVRMLSRHTSLDRPFYYPCADMRGTSLLRLASGYAWLPGEITEFPCPIPNCPYSKHAHNVFGYITVYTNKHVVYDAAEAVQTRAQFFFDNPFDRGKTFIAQCVSLEYSLEDNDVAHLKCVTHDPDLCAGLQEDMAKIKTVYSSIPLDVWQTCDNLAVAISHPHGMAKTISVGKHARLEVTVSHSHAHYHTAATCAGSSGGPVFYVCQKEKGGHPMWLPAVHSFHCQESNLNCAFR